MAFRSWLKLLAATTTAAAVVGAGQLGIAYGLGMVRLDQTLEITQRDQWTAQLAWVAWITMTAAAIGAVVATGLRPRWSPRPVGGGGALAMGVAAGIGALAVLPLTMQPARAARVAGVQPVLVIGICAGLAAAIGIFAGYAAAARAVARWSLTTVSLVVWAVALISVAPSLTPGDTPTPVRLGVLEGDLIPASVTEYTAFATMPVIALLAGLLLGWAARSRKLSTPAVALSGLAGPAMLTLAHLIAGPGSASGLGLNPYWAAMTASGAGVLGSVLAAVVRAAPDRAPTAKPGDSSAEPGTPSAQPGASSDSPADADAESTAGLPRRDAPQQSAIAAAAAAAAQRPEDQLRPSDTGVFSVADRPHPLQDLAAAPAAGSPFSSGSGNPFSKGPAQPTANTPPHGAPSGMRQSGANAGMPASASVPGIPASATVPGIPAPATVPGIPAPATASGIPAPATVPGIPAPIARKASAQVSASGGASIPAQAAGPGPAGSPRSAGMPGFAGQPDTSAEARFSGQQTAKSASGGLRRGWRSRRSSPEPQPTPPSAALTGDTGSFNGFAATHPGPRVGIDTAEHPRVAARSPRVPLVPEPTAVSAPLPHPQPIAPPPVAPAPQDPRRGKKGGREEDYVDWVNGLGGA